MGRRDDGFRALNRRQLFALVSALGAGGAILRPRLLLGQPGVPRPASGPVHALAMHGEPAYGPDFQHLAYVDPQAPKGGELRLADLGGFDSLNPFIIAGDAPAGIGLIYDTLTTQTEDEPFSQYGLLAETMAVGPNAAWVEFMLRPQARFHDGTPVTADDVVFSFETLRDQGDPHYRSYYADVTKAEITAQGAVRFTFAGENNRELPLIVGQLPVLSRRHWQGREFTKPDLAVPLGNGAYRVGKVEAGRAITYSKVADYWGRDLPINRGRFNFATIRYDYFRDMTAMLEAFKGGLTDVRIENVARLWATAYDFPAVRDGRVQKMLLPDHQPAGMQGFVFNTRRPIFADARVRQALGMTFDFEWANKTQFFGQYTRCDSYFSNSEMAAQGTPGAAELALLEPHRARLPDAVFAAAQPPPVSDGSGQDRRLLRAALAMLNEAGWTLEDGQLVGPDKTPMAFEFLLYDETFLHPVVPWVQNLARLGIAVTPRVIDPGTYKNRTNDFDFDMVLGGYPQSQSPGNEQRDFWSSAAAAVPGSRNLAGVRDPVVDALVDKVIYAESREALVTACRALDRVLRAGFYVVPNWYMASYRFAVWQRFGRPPQPALGLGFPDSWWYDAALSAKTGLPPGRQD